MKKTITILAAAAMLTAGGIDASNIYISNQGGFDDVHLYAWGASEAFGGWPGAAPSKTVTVGGAEYGVFATEAVGQLNLIYNYGGGASQLKDYSLDVESGKDYYFAAYESGMRVVEDPEGGLEGPDPFTLYIDNKTTWNVAPRVYAWADGAPQLFEWPGAESNGKATIDGIEWLTYERPASKAAYNFIFNDGGDTKVEGLTTVLESDLFVRLTDTSAELLRDPRVSYHTLYIADNTGWEKFYVYAYNEAGAPELFGGWPGAAASGTAKVGDVEYLTFPFPASETDYNLIFNNNDGTQYDAFQITADRDWYIRANAESAEEVTSGVKGVGIADGEAVYFNLQGERVAAPVRGLHIVVRGGKAAKVMF